jgi:hypothetical protein
MMKKLGDSTELFNRGDERKATDELEKLQKRVGRLQRPSRTNSELAVRTCKDDGCWLPVSLLVPYVRGEQRKKQTNVNHHHKQNPIQVAIKKKNSCDATIKLRSNVHEVIALDLDLEPGRISGIVSIPRRKYNMQTDDDFRMNAGSGYQYQYGVAAFRNRFKRTTEECNYYLFPTSTVVSFRLMVGYCPRKTAQKPLNFVSMIK